MGSVPGRSTRSLAVMTRDEAVARYSRLSRERQIRVLASYGHHVTIDARGTYVAGTEEVADPPQLRRANELLHRVLSHIRDLADDTSERFPDEVIVSMCWDASQESMANALEKS